MTGMTGKKIRGAIQLAVAAFFFVRFSCTAAEPGGLEAGAATVSGVLEIVGRWDDDAMRGLGERLETLPLTVASQALWLAASGSAGVDATSLFAGALHSPRPEIRRQAGDILLAAGDSVFVLERLGMETDEETMRHFVEALVLVHRGSPAQMLIGIMVKNESRPRLVAVVAEKLRETTRENIPDDPFAWRDWWQENSPHVP